MKLNLFILMLFILPFFVKANASFGAYKIVDGKVCDSCNVPIIQNFGEIVDYMIIGAEDEIEDASSVYKNADSKLPNLSKYLTFSSSFSLDFLVDDFWGGVGTADDQKWLRKKRLEVKPLQFAVLRNNVLIKDWTDISTLDNDKEFQPYKKEKKEDKVSLSANNFHAGNFQLNHDSLVVLIRSSVTKGIVQSILVKHKLYYPQVFDFIKFSSNSARQAYDDNQIQALLNLNNKHRLPTQIHKDSIDNFEMEPEETAIIQFEDPGIKHGELQFAFVNGDTIWSPFLINADPQQNFSSFGIEKPTPGKTIELMVRFTKQPESIHHIFIKVHGRLINTTWFKVTIAVLIAALLFAIWYAFKRRRHKAQLRKLTRNKEEIESKLQLLSGQLNPHFLFNSLNSVQNLINKHDTENANLYVSDVSTFLRTIMDAGKKEYISLEEELNMEEAYMKLEQKRKSFNYNIVNNCSTHLSQIEFPPALLQPVIENCIHHGFSREIEHPTITININCNEKQLMVLVTDNGQGFNADLINPGHGLAIVQKRISLVNEKLSGMTIEMKVTATNNGTVTTFTFQNWL